MATPASIVRFAALSAYLTGAVVSAQDLSAERSGLVGSFGVAGGSAGVNCDPKCLGDRQTGPTFMIRGAASVAPQLTLGVEVNQFNQHVPAANNKGRWQLTWITLDALWYPRAEEDLYFKVAVGISTIHAHATFPTVGALNMNSSNLGVVFGVGRDFRLANSYAITLFGDYLTTALSTAFISSTDSGARIGADVLNVGLALTLF